MPPYMNSIEDVCWTLLVRKFEHCYLFLFPQVDEIIIRFNKLSLATDYQQLFPTTCSSLLEAACVTGDKSEL
jgi:hypothetical protein